MNNNITHGINLNTEKILLSLSSINQFNNNNNKLFSKIKKSINIFKQPK